MRGWACDGNGGKEITAGQEGLAKSEMTGNVSTRRRKQSRQQHEYSELAKVVTQSLCREEYQGGWTE